MRIFWSESVGLADLTLLLLLMAFCLFLCQSVSACKRSPRRSQQDPWGERRELPFLALLLAPT